MLSILANSSIGLNLAILLFYLTNVFLTHFTLKFYFLTAEFLVEHDAFEQNSSRKMSLKKHSILHSQQLVWIFFFLSLLYLTHSSFN